MMRPATGSHRIAARSDQTFGCGEASSAGAIVKRADPLEQALEKRGDDSLVRDFLPKLAATRLRDPDPMERLKAVVDMMKTASPLAMPYAQQMLRDEDVIVRQRATEAIGRTGGPAAIPLLAQLQEDESPAVRDAAVRELERLQYPGMLK